MGDLLVRYHNLSDRQPIVEFRPRLLLCKIGFHNWGTTKSPTYVNLPPDIKNADDDDRLWIPFWCRRPGCLARCYSQDE